MRLAVDVMGGDQGPAELLEGIKLGLDAEPSIQSVLVVGAEDQLRPHLKRLGLSEPRVTLVHASEVLTMEDKPVQALRKKRDCSILRAVELVKEHAADAVISSGNTGGIVAASTIRLRPLENIERPTIACVLPTVRGAFVLVDGGANPDCTPENLLQFGIMGSIYAHSMLDIDKPRVGVLSNGSEESKGTELTRAALQLLRSTPLNCIGFCEGYDLFLDRVDVVVCDGFVGNIVLKSSESLGKAVGQMLRVELTANPIRKIGALLARGGLSRIKERMNPEAYGGAPLLGINGCVIKIHGSARRTTLRQAMRQSARFVSLGINETIIREVTRLTDQIRERSSA